MVVSKEINDNAIVVPLYRDLLQAECANVVCKYTCCNYFVIISVSVCYRKRVVRRVSLEQSAIHYLILVFVFNMSCRSVCV